jgi:hypothetical protein
MSTQTETTKPARRRVWGAKAIASHLGRTEKGAFSALESGRVPGAIKIAGRWALDLDVFDAAFEGVAA